MPSKSGISSNFLEFQALSEIVLQDLDRLLLWLCAWATDEIGLDEDQASDCWTQDSWRNWDAMGKCERYFKKVLLPAVDSPLLLVLDEVDRLFPYKAVARDFLGLLRTWREKGVRKEPWRKLRIVLVHSTEIYVDMPVSASPFNVGLPVKLAEFSPKQVLELAGKHGLAWQEGKEVTQLMGLVGGHPYLVRLALYHLAQGDLTLAQLEAEAGTRGGIYGGHLLRYLKILRDHPELLQAFKQVLLGNALFDEMATKRLQGLGLVTLEGNVVRVRYGFYCTYFQEHLAL